MRGKGTFANSIQRLSGITPAHAGKRSSKWTARTRSWDHPRACGEKQCVLVDRYSFPGSPPRMRGKVSVSSETARPLGITPAHAGKRILSLFKALSRRDHPRACGEKGRAMFGVIKREGSPPRMRGKGVKYVVTVVTVGITPAHAGKSQTPLPSQCPARDHPRACGEKYLFPQNAQQQPGSPPRMRGKAWAVWAGLMDMGITPAHAGKSA